MVPSSRDHTAPVPRRRADVTAATLDGEVVLYDAATQHLHHLNATAALVWEHCDGILSVAEIADAIAVLASSSEAGDPGVNTAGIRADVAALVEELRSTGLLDP